MLIVDRKLKSILKNKGNGVLSLLNFMAAYGLTTWFHLIILSPELKGQISHSGCSQACMSATSAILNAGLVALFLQV